MAGRLLGGWPVVAVVNGIDSAHRSLASLFFDDVRDESWFARDHEYAVERPGSICHGAGRGRIVIFTGAAQALAEVSALEYLAG